MTYNVIGFKADPYETFRVISEIDPDIVGVQELRPSLHELLQQKYPYHITTIDRGRDRLGLYSRFPIIDMGTEMPLRAVVEIEGQPVVVYVHHPPRPTLRIGRVYDDQRNELVYDQFVKLLDQETLPVLVLCDCNTTPRTYQYAMMDQRLDDAFKQQGWGFGLTHGGNYRLDFIATIRIDYIWYSDPIRPLHVEVSKDRGTSDHRPVWGEFMLQQ